MPPSIRFASRRPGAAPWRVLLLAAALAAAQVLVAAHEVEHAGEGAEHAACAICLAAGGLDSGAMPVAASGLPPRPGPIVIPPQPVPAHDPIRTAGCQPRGPPVPVSS